MANVQGKFYRGETQRSGVTPTSPPNAVDEPVGPLNPPGSGNTTTYKQLGDTTDKSFIGKNGYVPVVVNENQLTLQPLPNADQDGLISGGIVQWTGIGYNFNVSAALARFQGVFPLNSDPDILTLTTPDATNDRIDLFILQILFDGDGIPNGMEADFITGTPAVSPIKPQVNPATQIELTSVLVTAGSTTPTLTEEVVYDENTEWTGSTAGTGTGVFNSAVDPYQGSVSVETTNIQNGFQVQFNNGSEIDISTYQTFGFQINLKASLGANQNLYVTFLDGSLAPVSNFVLINLNKSLTGYQFIGIALNAVTFTSFDVQYIRFSFVRTSGPATYSGYFLDIVKLEGGIAPPVTQNTFLNLTDTPSSYIGQASKAPIVKANETGLEFAEVVLPTDRDYQISLTKGLISGGIVTINADPTKIDIQAGTGILVDDYTDPQNPVTYDVSWNAFIALPVTYLNTSTFSNILITNSGAVLQTSADPTDQERRENIYLVRLGHTALTQVESVVAKYSVAQSPMSQLNDLIDFVGLINLGNVVSPNGTNLSINKSAGKLHGKGVDYVVNPEIPNVIAIASQVAPTIRRRTRTGVGTNSTFLDVGNYDVAGAITALVGVKYTNQRVYLFPNSNIVVQYGQDQYNSLSAAISGLETESFVIYENLVDAALIGVISVRSTATDLSDPAQAYFGLVSKIGEIGIGSGGGTTTATLQQIYDNSSDPEIITDSTRGALTLRRGSAADTDPVFIGQNGAGSQTFAVTGAGIISDGTISPYKLIQEGATNGQALSWSTANSRYQPTTITSGVTTMAAIGATPNANGASISGATLNLQPASASFGGVVTTGTQTFAGDKTFAKVILPTLTTDSNLRAGTLEFQSFAVNNAWIGENIRFNGAAFQRRAAGYAGLFYFAPTGEGQFRLYGTAAAGTTIVGYKVQLKVDYLGVTVMGGDAISNVAGVYSGATMRVDSDGVSIGRDGNAPVGRVDIRGVGTTTGTTLLLEDSAGVNNVQFVDNGNIVYRDGSTWSLGTTTGTKIGITTSQKLAFWNKTPIIQPTTGITAAAFVANTSGIANDTATYGGYTIGQIAAALINVGILA